MTKRALVRASIFAVAASSLIAGAVAFTPTGSALARGVIRMAHGGCPFGYDRAPSAAERERARLHFAATHRGEQRATNRPALGFTLDHTTRAQVLAAMTAQGVECSAGRGVSDLTCSHVPSTALSGATAPLERSLWFTFGARDQLLSLISVARAANAETVSNAFISAQDVLNREAGAATRISGSADPQSLSEARLQQASAEFRFTNYYALERAANMGNRFVLTEEYRSLPD
jgi:hypothetical protein